MVEGGPTPEQMGLKTQELRTKTDFFVAPDTQHKTLTAKDKVNTNESFLDFEKKILQLIPVVDNGVLRSMNIRIHSDQPLSEADITFITGVKSELDDTTQNETDNVTADGIKIIICNQEHWAQITENNDLATQHMGSQFSGASVAIPGVPRGHKPLAIIPSEEVLTKPNDYLRAFNAHRGCAALIADDPKKAYENIYLRNFIAHEMSHLYNFSSKTAGEISKNQAEVPNDLTEFLACCYGLKKMYESAEKNFTSEFVGACQLAVEQPAKETKTNTIKRFFRLETAAGRLAIPEDTSYQAKQAGRTVKGLEFAKSMSQADFEELLKKMNEINKRNDELSFELQGYANNYINGTYTVDTFVGLLYHIFEKAKKSK